MRATNIYGHVFNMPVNVCKASTRHTRSINGTCQPKDDHENPALIARSAGSYSFYWHHRKVLSRAAITLQSGNQRPQKHFVKA